MTDKNTERVLAGLMIFAILSIVCVIAFAQAPVVVDWGQDANGKPLRPVLIEFADQTPLLFVTALEGVLEANLSQQNADAFAAALKSQIRKQLAVRDNTAYLNRMKRRGVSQTDIDAWKALPHVVANPPEEDPAP